MRIRRTSLSALTRIDLLPALARPRPTVPPIGAAPDLAAAATYRCARTATRRDAGRCLGAATAARGFDRPLTLEVRASSGSRRNPTRPHAGDQRRVPCTTEMPTARRRARSSARSGVVGSAAVRPRRNAAQGSIAPGCHVQSPRHHSTFGNARISCSGTDSACWRTPQSQHLRSMSAQPESRGSMNDKTHLWNDLPEYRQPSAAVGAGAALSFMPFY
jgi:hypothetical protein